MFAPQPMVRASLALTMVCVGLVGALVQAGTLAVAGPPADWPQYLGPNRNGVFHETGLAEKVPEGGWKVQWRAAVSGGYAGPSVSGGRVYVADFVREAGEGGNDPGKRRKVGGVERVVCFSADKGDQVWKYEQSCVYDISYPAGPRATPTVADGKVYALGAMGHLHCLDAQTGKPLWQKDLVAEYKTQAPLWGFCSHPLVSGKLLYLIVGGEGSVAVALDKNTGEEAWRALSAKEPGYSAPMIAKVSGREVLVIWHAESINGLEPTTGKPLWSFPLAPSYGMSIAVPQQQGEYLYASGNGFKALALKLDANGGAEELWRGNNGTGVYSGNPTPLILNNIIYGCCRDGQLRGVELLAGKRLWETLAATSGDRPGSYVTAFLARNADRWYLLNEKGELILAKLSPEGYQEIGRSKVMEPTGEAFGRTVLWSPPAFADKAAFIRNDKELIRVSLAE